MESLHFQLRKPKSNYPWGFRIQGGRDFNRPLIISRIAGDSVANAEGLKCGDEIVKINNHVTTFLTHYEAQEMIIQCGDELNLEISRASSTHSNKPGFADNSPYRTQNLPTAKNTIQSPARVGCATNVQMSHSNYDLTHRTPVCRLCGNEIRGPFLIVLDYCFCPNHFHCHQCQCDLTRETFIEVGSFFYCEEDYSKFMAPKCQKCNNPVVLNEISAANSRWHAQCFNCNRCGVNLAEKIFKIGDDGMAYCLEDWNHLFQVKCDRCNYPITVMDKYVEIGENTYHAKCFTCSACKTPLYGKYFHNRSGKPFCKIHANAGILY